MARQKIIDKIDEVKIRRDQINSQLKALELKHREDLRKEDLRRKIIAGTQALEYRDKNPDDPFSIMFNSLLEKHVKRPNDRALFGLKPLEE